MVTVSQPMTFLEEGAFSVDKVDELSGQSEKENEHKYKTAAEYIETARKQISGRVIQSNRSSLQSATDVVVNPTIVNSVGETGADGVNAGDLAAAALPTPFAPTAPEPPPGGSDNPSLSSRQSILIGINDKITEKMLRKMSDASDKKRVNYVVNYSMVQISCNPGWRTRSNYIADVSATCQYADENGTMIARKQERLGHQPTVFGVLPLLDAQTLDLSNSNEEVLSLVAQVAAAFPSSVGKISLSSLLKFVKEYKNSVQTRTPLTVTNSYSSGSTFGFRFAPSLTAIYDAASKNSPSANVLQPTAFPALVVIVYRVDDIDPKITKTRRTVVVNINTRWLINQRPPLTQFWRFFTTPLKRESAEMRLSWAEDAEKLREYLINTEGEEDRKDFNLLDLDLERQSLRRDIYELRDKAIGQSRLQIIPRP